MKTFKNIALVCMLATLLVGCGSSVDSAGSYIESGKALLAEGKPEKARLEFKNAIQVDPKVAESYYQLALLDGKSKNWKAMFANLQRAEQLDAKHFDAIVKLGRLYLLSGDTALALEQAVKVIKEDPENTKAWVLKSSVSLKEGNYGSAITDVERALKSAPSNVDAISLKATLLNKLDKPKQAISLLTSTIQSQPDVLPLKVLLLTFLEKQKDYPAMEAVYEKLKITHASKKWVFVSLAKLYSQLGDYTKAKGVLEEFVNAQPDNKEAKLLLVSLIQTKEPEKAIALLDLYIKKSGDNAKLRFAKVESLLTVGKTAEAVNELKEISTSTENEEDSNKANVMLAGFDMQNKQQEAANSKLDAVLTKAPEYEGALIMKAKIFVFNKENDSAITRLRVVLRNNPESEQALVLLAQAYMRTGSSELAEDSFRQALSVNPGNTVAALSVAKGLMKSNNLNRTEAVLLKALKKTPNNDGLLQTLAQVKLLKKDWLGTQSIVDELLQTNKNSAVANYLDARISQGQERYADAIIEYKKVLEINPNITRALQGLALCSVKLEQEKELLAFLKDFNIKNPRQFIGYAIQAHLYVKEKSVDQAVAVLKEGLVVEPKWLRGYSAMASAYLSEKDVDSAINAYKEGLSALPESNALAMKLASLYERNGEFSEARKLYEEVLRRNADIEPAINNLASLLTDEFRSEENLKKAEEMTRRFKTATQPYYLDTYAWVNVQLGHLDSSELILERVVSLAPNVAAFNYHLGALYVKQKNNVKAEKYLGIAKDLANKQGDQLMSEKVNKLLAISK